MSHRAGRCGDTGLPRASHHTRLSETCRMHLNDFFASVKVGDESLEECNVDVSPEDSAATRVLRCYVASSKGQVSHRARAF